MPTIVRQDEPFATRAARCAGQPCSKPRAAQGRQRAAPGRPRATPRHARATRPMRRASRAANPAPRVPRRASLAAPVDLRAAPPAPRDARRVLCAARLQLTARAFLVPHGRKRSLLRPSNTYNYPVSLRGKPSHSFSRNLRLLSASLDAILGLKRVLLDFSFSEVPKHSRGLPGCCSL